jgi:hypothetical protein
MHWREPVGTVVGTVGLMAWVGLGALIARAAYGVLEQHAITAHVLVFVTATIFAVGGLVIFWVTAEQIEFWRLGYRVRQLSPKGFFHWSLGPKQCVYEERAPDGQIQGLPFVRMILGDGYPAPCEVVVSHTTRHAPRLSENRDHRARRGLPGSTTHTIAYSLCHYFIRRSTCVDAF